MLPHRNIHTNEIAQARLRFLYNDLLYLASKLELEARASSAGSVYGLKTLKHTYQFIDSLPYHLTDDQYHIFHIFSEQMRIGKRINSLIQGDVGCGKTIVAYIAMFMAADSGYQSVLLAPTNVLARQHYNDLRIYSEKYGYKAAFLNGSLKAAEKKKILKEIHNGDYDFIVGTHSVFSKNVEYQNLALIVTDEEHKFGVKQRIALESKAKVGVHTISMSATPIPRSLAQTLYGGLKDVYNINTLPNGRKEIRSQIFQNNAGSFKFIYNEIRNGRQAYVVCKYVEESEKNTVVSVKDAYADLCDFFKNTDVKIGIVTGKTNKSEADATLTAFKNNEINILVATTIVEVGVNVPNASVIMIYDADMYGLSQLHQLRGRVGRGNEQGYCILNTGVDEITHTYREVPERLEFFCTTTDGFKIAAEDLKFRGAGDLIGTKQSGFNKYIDKMLCNPILYSTIKETIKKMADYGICNEVIENFERNEREV